MKKIFSAFLFLGYLSCTTLFAQSSFLDSTFADNGTAVINLNFNPNYSQLEHVALQSDGKIIVVGTTSNTSGSRAFAVRLNPDGSLDTSFGENGEWVSTDQYFLIANEVLVQPDDKIVITGWGAGLVRAVRLTPDGDYDSTFGVNGAANVNVWGGGANIMIDMELQPDGKILISGYKAPESVVVRLNADGTVDNFFGTSGKVIIKPSLFGSGTEYVYGLKIGLSSDNAILVSGKYSHPVKPSPGFVIKYKSNGQMETNFGTNGIAEFYNLEQQVSDLFVLPNDEILVLCDIRDSVNTYPYITLVKWLPNGQMDASYGNNGYGKLTVTENGSYTRHGYLQTDGKVVVLVIYEFPGSPDTKPSMCRFNTDGTLDTTFGNGGRITNEAGGFYNGLVQPDGKIVTVGGYLINDNAQIGGVRRYFSSMLLSASEPASGITSAFVFPNPVADHPLVIQYMLQQDSPIKMDLWNMNGEILTTLLDASRQSGQNEEQLELPDHLADGVYFISIQTEKGMLMTKFLHVGQ